MDTIMQSSRIADLLDQAISELQEQLNQARAARAALNSKPSRTTKARTPRRKSEQQPGARATRVPLDDRKAQVTHLLGAGEMDAAEVARQIGVSRGYARNILGMLADEGQAIEVRNDRDRTAPSRYRRA